MRKLTAAAIVAGTAGALAWPPSRRWLASMMILTGAHLDHGPDADLTDEQRTRLRRAVLAEQARKSYANGTGPI